MERATFKHGDREVTLTGDVLGKMERAVGMITGELMNDTKQELGEALQAVGKASRELRASTLVEIEGVGNYNHSAFLARRLNFILAVEAVNSLWADTVPNEGLLETG